ncbi:MAG: 3-dehydroquinate synthase [Clostridia bacterium]|nr:3-dehydroquinate synthase [Clostridia bacterium]
MQEVMVSASNGDYFVHIGKGLISQLGAISKDSAKGNKVMLISDDRVFPLWGEIAVQSLKDAGYEVFTFIFPNGEQSKNIDTLSNILNALGENHLYRDDIIVALGGGVVGDISGLAAALYQRGIGFVSVPTTLLAAVDSSVGGKTAVDLPCGKNLCGAFWQPKAVVCDTNTLSTLTDDIFACGMAEVIK